MNTFATNIFEKKNLKHLHIHYTFTYTRISV